MSESFFDGRVEIITGDITECHVDIIVNAANESLLGGGGVDGAIHRKAGPKLLLECRGIGGCPTGEARVTQAYDLPARFVIHTVGPVWKGGNSGEEKRLASCYVSVFARAEELIDIGQDLSSMAIPAISTGVYGYPAEKAARTAALAARDYLQKGRLTHLLYVGFGPAASGLLTAAFAEINGEKLPK